MGLLFFFLTRKEGLKFHVNRFAWMIIIINNNNNDNESNNNNNNNNVAHGPLVFLSYEKRRLEISCESIRMDDNKKIIIKMMMLVVIIIIIIIIIKIIIIFKCRKLQFCFEL